MDSGADFLPAGFVSGNIAFGQWRGACAENVDQKSIGNIVSSWDSLKQEKGVRVYKDSPETEVLGLNLNIAGGEQSVVVKRYKYRGPRQMAARIAGRDPARRLWKGSLLMLRNGFGVPKPLAYIEPKNPLSKADSFCITEEFVAGRVARSFVENELGRERVEHERLAKMLGELFAGLHERGLYHRDLKANNILVRRGKGVGEFEVAVIDLEDVRCVRAVSTAKRVHNIAQFVASFIGCGSLGAADGMRFWRAYSNRLNLDRSEGRKFIRAVLEEAAGRGAGRPIEAKINE